jgi:t-SNARE complex subunit (syntaxin)
MRVKHSSLKKNHESSFTIYSKALKQVFHSNTSIKTFVSQGGSGAPRESEASYLDQAKPNLTLQSHLNAMQKPKLPELHVEFPDFQQSAPPKQDTAAQSFSTPKMSKNRLNELIPEQEILLDSSLKSTTDYLESSLSQIDQNVQQLSQLYKRALIEPNPTKSKQLSQECEWLMASIGDSIQSSRNSIRDLPTQFPRDQQAIVQQRFLAQQLLTLTSRYANLQRDAQNGFQANFERQYRVMNPNASPEQIQAALQGQINQQSDPQILDQLETRQHDLNTILSSLNSLVDLMSEMQFLLEVIPALINLFIATTNSLGQNRRWCRTNSSQFGRGR